MPKSNMITFIKSFIITVLIIMFAISITQLLTGCTWKQGDKISCKTETEISRTCEGETSAKQLEIIIERRNPDE